MVRRKYFFLTNEINFAFVYVAFFLYLPLFVLFIYFSLCFHSGGLMSIDAGNRFSWESYELGPMPLPVVDIEGGVLASDGYTLAGYDPTGNVVGVTALFPENGLPLDLTYTANGVVLIIYQCGLLTAYLTSNVSIIHFLPCKTVMCMLAIRPQMVFLMQASG